MIANPPGGHLDRMLARCRFADLFAQHVLGEVPAAGDDLHRPSDASAAKEEPRPTTVAIAAVRGVDADDAPRALNTRFAVDLEARRSTQAAQSARRQSIEHKRSSP